MISNMFIYDDLKELYGAIFGCGSLNDVISANIGAFVASKTALLLEDKAERLSEEEFIDRFPPAQSYNAPKFPVILCHGLSGFDRLILIPSVNQLTKLLRASISAEHSALFMEEQDTYPQDDALLKVDYWLGVREALQNKGCTVMTARVPSFGSIEERATVLNSFIENEVGKLKRTETKRDVYNTSGALPMKFKEGEKVKVNLIAHSMGGLDCRFLISRIPKKNYEVCSLTTISTPHHGSEMADYVVKLFTDISRNRPKGAKPIFLPQAFYELTTYYCKYFNNVTLDDPNVSYFSYGAYFSPRWYNLFYMSWKIIKDISGGRKSDGLVTPHSAKWGNYRGTLVNVDHSDLINWKNHLQTKISWKLQGSLKKASNPDIDILQFYLKITDDLARMGF